MDQSTLASIIYTTAASDKMNWKGRIILSDLRIDLPGVTAEEIMAAWKLKFPEYPIEHRTENTLIIELGRKK
jgi:hypothetical protein